MINYIERKLKTHACAMDLLLAIANSGLEENYAIYEQPDEWSIALGQFATIKANHDTVTLQYENQSKQFCSAQLCESINQATTELPIRNWRLYGKANFELSHIFHGVKLQANNAENTLIELFVPKYEIRIKGNEALLRAITACQLEKLTTLFSHLDLNQADINHPLAEQIISCVIPTYQQAQYKKIVQQAVSDIQANHYQKVILSRRIPLPGGIDIIDSFRTGRLQNTPARSFLYRQNDYLAAGFSPETVVEVTADRWVSTQPLAGTRAMGINAAEEAKLKAELLADTKEISEHAISVKLALQELQTVCRNETISITEFMKVRRRGSVQHLASRVKGQLQPNKNAWDAFAILFPAVTASGIPKKEAIEAIHRYETQARDLYSGCIMIVDSSGAMDAALVLRTIYNQGDKYWLQAGAGIVDQSKPERELEETIEKLSCIMKHLKSSTVPAYSSTTEAQELEMEIV